LLMIEIFMFPLLGGWWLDVCAAPLTGGTMSSRWAMWGSPPPLRLLRFWLVGLLHMLHVSAVLNQLRELVRPGVLAAWIRDPMDPEYNPFREMVEHSPRRHAMRVCMVLGIFAALGAFPG
jgi:E3 ubiquitin-protein ligase DOA10